jgi:hypothetical protein
MGFTSFFIPSASKRCSSSRSIQILPCRSNRIPTRINLGHRARVDRNGAVIARGVYNGKALSQLRVKMEESQDNVKILHV